MLEQRIDAWIAEHQKELLTDIELLVSCPSISKENGGQRVYGADCAKALETMLALGEEYGFQTENADYYCGVITYGDQPKSIGLWGHLDVVPEGNDWIYPPYACTRKGDFLIGRGVQDNKGPTIAGLYAMRCIRDLGLPMTHSIQQIVGCAEETGMSDVIHYVKHYEVPAFNIITDCGFPVCYGEKGIIECDLRSEPVSGEVLAFNCGTVSNIVPDLAVMTLKDSDALQQKLLQLPAEITVEQGTGSVTLTAHGLSKHAAFPEGSVNAAEKLCRAVLEAGLLSGKDRDIFITIHRICATTDGSAVHIACADELSGALTCVGGVMKLKQGSMVVSLNIRYPISAKSAQLQQAIRTCAENDGFELCHMHNSDPNYFDPSSPYVQSLTATYNRVMGTQEKPFVMGGGTYARKIPNAVAFGPGLPTDSSSLGLPEGHGPCHAPDECQSISNLYTALKIYVLALVELDAVMHQQEE